MTGASESRHWYQTPTPWEQRTHELLTKTLRTGNRSVMHRFTMPRIVVLGHLATPVSSRPTSIAPHTGGIALPNASRSRSVDACTAVHRPRRTGIKDKESTENQRPVR